MEEQFVHLYLIRHADPDYRNDTLTEAGFAEAIALSKRLEKHGLDFIYSSPITRSKLTAKFTAERLKKEICEKEWLIEPPVTLTQNNRIYSIWDTFGETIKSGHKMPTEDDWYFYSPFADSGLKDIWDIFRNEMDEMLDFHGYHRVKGRFRIMKSNEDRIGIFSHNGTNIMLISYLLNIPLPLVCCGFFSWPSSVTTIYFEKHSTEWAVPRALGVADISHIYNAGLMPNPRALGEEPYEPYH